MISAIRSLRTRFYRAGLVSLSKNRPTRPRVLYYRIANWGGAINADLAQLITKEPIARVDINAWRALDAGTRNKLAPVVSGIGSILAHADEHTIVWGSGLQGTIRLRGKPLEIRAVRGPMSRAELLQQGIDCPEVYGDPALLLPRFYTPKSRPPRYELGLVAHRKDARDPRIRELGRDPRVRSIDMRTTGMSVIDAFLDCRRVVSSSLHGLVVADAYGIAAGWIRVSERIPGGFFKYHDYHASIGVSNDRPLRIETATTVDELINHCDLREVRLDLDQLLRVCPLLPMDTQGHKEQERFGAAGD